MPDIDAPPVLTPREIVAELDRFVVGQAKAKRAVAIALRNRWRRQQVPEHLRDEIAPKNIIMIGPTGVGKTEIARRLARLAQSPFLKVEASKFTEVGYVGRDVESMIRDLTELAVTMVKAEERQKVEAKAEEIAEERLLDIFLPSKNPRSEGAHDAEPAPGLLEVVRPGYETMDAARSTREKLRRLLRSGKMDDRYVDVEVSDAARPMVEVFSNMGLEEMGHQHQGPFRRDVPQADQDPQGQGARGPQAPGAGGIPAPDRHGSRHPDRPGTGRAERDHLHRRARQGGRPGTRPGART